MFAASVGGARIEQFWRCEWDSGVTSGMPLGMISLETRPVSGMKSTGERGWVNIPPNRRSGRHGGTERDQYVCRFLGAWCRRHPGTAVFLSRVGFGTRHARAELGRMCRIESPYSRQFGLDCVTAAAVDAVYQVLGQCSAVISARKFQGPQIHKSLRSIGRLYQRAQLRCRIVKLSNIAISAIENSDNMMAFKWFSDNARKGVYIVHLNSAEGLQHAVVVDATRRCILDSAQLCALHLTTEALYVCAGSGVGSPRIISGRKVVPY